jgi:hypothetical protein
VLDPEDAPDPEGVPDPEDAVDPDDVADAEDVAELPLLPPPSSPTRAPSVFARLTPDPDPPAAEVVPDPPVAAVDELVGTAAPVSLAAEGVVVVGLAAITSAAVSLRQVVFGPWRPGGAPPGSGHAPFGFEGSVSLTPG